MVTEGAYLFSFDPPIRVKANDLPVRVKGKVRRTAVGSTSYLDLTTLTLDRSRLEPYELTAVEVKI